VSIEKNYKSIRRV